jgi:predicted RecB family nuclease
MSDIMRANVLATSDHAARRLETWMSEPSPGDVFFDLEGDPFIGERGLEYLFGYAFSETNGTVVYRDDWASMRESEKSPVERFIDFVVARLEAWPDLHIYHFAPYETVRYPRSGVGFLCCAPSGSWTSTASSATG